MRARIDPGPRLLALAAAQAGVVSREQALGLGLTPASIDRLLAHGWWQRLTGGLYLTRPGPVPWPSLAWGGVLIGGPEARLGGTAAGHLHDLLDDPPDVVTVLVPHGVRRPPRGPWQFAQERPGVRRGARGDPPRLDLEDCTLDLCDQADPARVVDVVTRAVQTRRTTTGRLARRLASRPRHSQRRLLGRLLAEVTEGAESPLELRYLLDVERPHGLPRGSRQHRSRGSARDVYYQRFATVVELDGRTGHVGAGRHRDMTRDNRSTAAGDATLRYGWWDVVERPCDVAAEVAAVLGLRGWAGTPTPCPRCSGVE